MSCLQEMVAPLPPGGVQEICACYFETHVSPMLKIMQSSLELRNAKLEDSYTSVQKELASLRVEHNLLKVEFAEIVAKSAGNAKVSTLKPTQERNDGQMRLTLPSGMPEQIKTLVAPRMHGGFEVTAIRDGLPFSHGDSTPPWDKDLHKDFCFEKPGLDKDLREPTLEQEITFLSDDSTEDPCEATFLSEDSTPEPCSARLRTHELHSDTEADVLQKVEPTKQDVPKRGLSEILKLKLTTAEEENERLQQVNDQMSMKLQELEAMSMLGMTAV